jgi:hypothetical protein
MVGDLKIKNIDCVGTKIPSALLCVVRFQYTLIWKSGLDFFITASIYLGLKDHTPGWVEGLVLCNQHTVSTHKLLLEEFLTLVDSSSFDKEWPILQPGSILHRSAIWSRAFWILNGLESFIVLSVSAHLIVRNHGTKHLTIHKESFSFLHLLGSVLGDDKHEEAIMIGPPPELLASACHQQNRKRKTPTGSPVCARMEDFHHPQSQEACHRNYPPYITRVHPEARSFFLANMTVSSTMGTNYPWLPTLYPQASGYLWLITSCSLYMVTHQRHSIRSV